MAGVTKLPDRLKTFIVEQLAAYETPTEVAIAVKQDFGLELSRQAIEAYDPNKAASRNLGERWRELFKAKRAEYQADAATIGVANKGFRLRQLEKLYFDALKKRNPVLAAQLLEQAAKESGGSLTNKREISGPNGGPVQTTDNRDLSPIAVCRRIALLFNLAEEERKRRVAEREAEAAQKVIEHA